MVTPLIMSPESNLSVAWAKAFIELMKPGKEVRHPAVITIQGFDITSDIENTQIRDRLNQELKK